MKTQYLFLIFCIFAVTGYGQVAPVRDKNWVMNRALSDEFNGANLDTTKWEIREGHSLGYAKCYSRNVMIEDIPTKGIGIDPNIPHVSPNRMLRLRAEWASHGTTWGATGGIYSKNANYLYGYYEMRARLPGYYNDSLQQPCNRGFWSAFWTYHQERDPNDWNCIIEHNEIDIVEPNGYGVERDKQWVWEDDAQTNEVSHHMLIEYNPCKHTKLAYKIIKNLPPLYEDFHKFAAECLPDRIIYYFDDIPFHTVFVSNKIPLPDTLMYVAITHQLQSGSDDWERDYGIKNVFKGYNTPWPIYYDVDYFRYYQLNTQYCGTDALITNNNQLYSFVYGVRRNITIGNGSSAISLNSGTSVTFRATNDVTINGEFTVPLGCELNIIPTLCH